MPILRGGIGNVAYFILFGAFLARKPHRRIEESRERTCATGPPAWHYPAMFVAAEGRISRIRARQRAFVSMGVNIRSEGQNGNSRPTSGRESTGSRTGVGWRLSWVALEPTRSRGRGRDSSLIDLILLKRVRKHAKKRPKTPSVNDLHEMSRSDYRNVVGGRVRRERPSFVTPLPPPTPAAFVLGAIDSWLPSGNSSCRGLTDGGMHETARARVPPAIFAPIAAVHAPVLPLGLSSGPCSSGARWGAERPGSAPTASSSRRLIRCGSRSPRPGSVGCACRSS